MKFLCFLTGVDCDGARLRRAVAGFFAALPAFWVAGSGSDPVILSSLVPAEKADCYRKATIEVIAASQVVRKYTFPNAFVVDYKEDYGDMEGVGTFRLMIKQKKDKMSQIAIEGGYSL